MQGIREVIIAQQVYMNNGKRYVKDNKKGYKGLTLWKEVEQIIGKIHITTGNCFYLDDHGFELI